MAYLSLYRRFRPDTFEKMVRQEHVTTVLRNQIVSGSVGHAYLFCGPRGTGKTSVARIFARAVSCEHPVNGSPCGVCPVCRALSDTSGSLDIVEIDAASNNGVNEMRELREKVQYPPVEAKYKIYIIDEVQMLTDSAFNALLKTLEEPPAHVIFILATTEPHKIPATILSRCMRLDFKLIPEADLEAHLKRVLDEIGKPYDDEAVSAIARAGAGSDRDMLSIAQMCISYGERLTYEGVTQILGAADFRQTALLCEALLCSDLPRSLALTERILSEGKAVGVLCRDVLQMLNRISIAKCCRNAEGLLSLPREYFERIAEIAERAEGRAILRATEIFAKAENDLRFVSSPRICFETAVIKIALPSADESTDALFVRLAELERLLPRAEACPAPAAHGVCKKAPKEKVEQKKTEREEDEAGFPAEEPVFLEAIFPEETAQDGSIPPTVEPSASVDSSEPAFIPDAGAAPVVGEERNAELLYGKFIRLLRRTSRNGVLFTMCSDLEAVYEGDSLILYTESATVFRALNREEHLSVMRDVFARLGVADFEVRRKGEEKRPDEKDALRQLQRDFKDYPIETK